ncbi:DNA-directed RNA polymerase sigma-70 factor [Luteitalea sp. TBR-22]|uniref:RNA polymerase sigma factor n=1 Tax=Luteitalea sp. TBR-22 TaxID=2802971 RepID=UPI001AFC5D7A|nr:RNA polymerase sigma factor [Luteitalea sp. TBR-22]BCS30982.1 DNA-directed RNA polymerase sigma-70 factor [Luteitalea sp. TBR-22]
MHAGQSPPHRDAADEAKRTLFDRLYQEHGPSLFRYLRRLAGADDDPADLLHETFLRLWTQPAPEAIANLRAWLFRVATNVAHNRRRDMQRSRHREQAVVAPDAALEDPVARLDAQAQVQRALASIDDVRARRALLLFAEGFTYREIAGILDLAPGHVGVLIQRGRDQFRPRGESTP